MLIFRRAAGTALVAAGVVGVLAHAAFFGQLAPRLEPLWLSQRLALALERTGLAPRAGVVVEILVGDSQPVEFGQPLVILE